PFASHCTAFAAGTVEAFPVKPAKKVRETRRGIAFVARARSGEAFLVRRQDSGMLGGMLAFPSTGWATRGEDFDSDAALDAAPFPAAWRRLDHRVQHVFTHFAVEMEVAVADITAPADVAGPAVAGDWKLVRPADLPSLMRKVWKAAHKATAGPERAGISD
ncbi:MAG: NUDIX domain-containing protein, partial [Candidatus Puniceispirillaceae bacterium]